MSADNGIYILFTTGPEYRVAHLQAVENVYWDEENGEETNDPNVRIKNAREMWANSPVYTSRLEALGVAADMLNNEPICEYGISFISIPMSFYK